MHANRVSLRKQSRFHFWTEVDGAGSALVVRDEQ